MGLLAKLRRRYVLRPASRQAIFKPPWPMPWSALRQLKRTGMNWDSYSRLSTNRLTPRNCRERACSGTSSWLEAKATYIGVRCSFGGEDRVRPEAVIGYGLTPRLNRAANRRRYLDQV